MSDDLKTNEESAKPKSAENQAPPPPPLTSAVQANPTRETTEGTQKPRRKRPHPLIRIARIIRRHRREGPKWTDVAIVVLTCGIVYLAWTQHRDLIDAGAQTDKIIIADQRIATAMELSVGAAGTALNATIAQNQLDQRAWVAVIGVTMDAPEVGKKINGSVTWMNSGKTFARKVKPLCHVAFFPELLTSEDVLREKAVKSPASTPVSIGVLTPNAQYKTLIDSTQPVNEVDKTNISGSWYTYIWGELTYDDIFKQPHTTVFCSYRQGGTGDFLQCHFHNDAN